ncbi:MAG: AAC(3) family N-acetyltransferase [Oceanicaulis sp.]
MSRAEAVARLAQRWRRSGLTPGGMTLVHSSLRRTLAGLDESADVDGPGVVLDSLAAAVGEAGTLLFPLFNFDFTRGAPFDMRKTVSHMGALTEAARVRPGAVRTGHPVYSFAAIGAEAGRFEGLVNTSGYGADSPFAVLREAGGRIAVLDLPDQQSMTFYHHVEESLGAPWRYHKAFEGDWTGLDGETRRRAFSIYVRDLERGVITHVDPMGERLWSERIWRGDRPGRGTGLRVADARAVFDAAAEVIRAGNAKGLLYTTAP